MVFDLNEAQIYVLILCVKVLSDAVKSLFCSPSRSKKIDKEEIQQTSKKAKLKKIYEKKVEDGPWPVGFFPLGR